MSTKLAVMVGRLFGRRLPVTTGTLRVEGVAAPVRIRRDEWGVPYVEAASDEDTWFGLGFCQGQDRTFQLESLTRTARGTIAELVGRPGLRIDRLSRRLGFRRTAELQWPLVDPDGQRAIAAYCRGVRAGASAGSRRRPLEMTLLRARSAGFDEIDALAIGKLLGFLMSSNWDVELARLDILRRAGADAVRELDPGYPSWLPVTSPPGTAAGDAVVRLAADVEELRRLFGSGGASNHWAIAPARTRTGRPVLASDPHLAPILPVPWYLAHLRTPDFTVAGASFVGFPGIFVGFNEHGAWGATNGFADTSDLFLEEVGPDRKSVRQGDRLVGCELRKEVLRVRGGRRVEELVLVTPRGPVISPALDGEGEAISIRATWLDPAPVRIPLLHRVESFEQFRRAFDPFPLGSFNMVWAGKDGSIGWQLVGTVPRRRKGWGTMPAPGWDPEVGWDESPVPFDAMPWLENPKEGFVATANNRPVAGGEGPFLGIDWMDGYRIAAIARALEARSDWDLTSSSHLQKNLDSIPWEEIRSVVLAAPTRTAESRQAAGLLVAWDGRVSPDSIAATVFELFVAAIIRRIVEARAPGCVERALGKGFTLLRPHTFLAVRRVSQVVRLVREQPDGWVASWPDTIAAALDDAMRNLRRRRGSDPRRWVWGSFRPLVLRHPLGRIPGLGRLFDRGPYPLGGDTNTIAQAAVDPADPGGPPIFLPNLRMVVDVGAWENNTFALAGGQSGNPLSAHYDDLLELWLEGRGLSLAWTDRQIGEAARETLELMPVLRGQARPEAGPVP